MKTHTLAIGDKVAYGRGFLRSTAQYTGPVAPTHYGAFARGTVTGFDDLSGDRKLVSVLWADGASSRVLDCNLVAVKRIHLEAA